MKNNINFKETNISWIGEIPIEWSLIRSKYLFNRTKEINKDLKCKNLLSLTYEGVLNKDFYASEGLRPENYNTYQLFDKDDLVFKMIDLENVKTSRVGIVHEYGIMSSAYICFKPLKEKIYPKFSYWFFYDLYKKEIYNSIGCGVRSTLSSDDMSEFEIPVPQIKEQKIISRYLDKKITQINSLVEKIQKKIKLLKELKSSLINQCVTKGLDPNVEMKDSNFEWIGEIPNDWKVSRLDFLSSIKGRIGWKALKADEYVDDGFIFLSTPNISNKKIDFDNVNYITQERYNESPELKLKQEDVLLVKDGSTLGVTNFVRELPKEATVNSSIAILKVFNDKIVPEFLYWFVSGYFIQNIIQRIKGGMGVPHLFQSDIKKFLILLPSIQEQYKIINVLNEEVGKLDNSIQFEKNKIKLLKEYHQSLIYSVVTGKVRIMEDMV